MLVYLITNRVNGKKYVGQTHKTVRGRWQSHCWDSNRTKNMPIHQAIRKYGKEAFTIEELFECSSQDQMDMLEIMFVLSLNTFSPNGYNLRAGQGRGIVSDATREKISKINKGKKVSEETRQRLSESHKGIPMSDSNKERLRHLFKGKDIGNGKGTAASMPFIVKDWVVTNPQGEVMEIRNLAQFCRDNDLSGSDMCEVGKGLKKNYKGWTVKRAELRNA